MSTQHPTPNHENAPDAQANQPSADGEDLQNFRGLQIELRRDVQITRQLLRGEPTYVIHDPVSFQTQRLSLNDYRVICELRDDLSLHVCFRNAVAKGILSESREREFYQFIQQLHGLGILSIPNYDSATLYERHQQQNTRRTNPLGILFLTQPLANPDRFLDRTIGWFRGLFSRTAFFIWLIALTAACGLVVIRWSEFARPLNGLLAAHNLLFISAAFVALKVWHELGHAYACKHFGGRVPEMGVKLILGMPLAYVDASAAWSFPIRRNRILVMLGGMYFESLVAIPATFVWAFAGEGFVSACAYQLIFMAGVATVLFNANPLMRFDGYFVLSELLGIQNLRQKAFEEVKDSLCHLVLRLPRQSRVTSARDRVLLLTYGVSSTAYSITLIISIAVLLASRFLIVGVGFAAYQLLTMAGSTTRRLWNFLTADPRTESIRGRSRGLAYAMAVCVPAAICMIPAARQIQIDAIVSAATESKIVARTAGFVDYIGAEVGNAVVRDQPIVQLVNLDVTLDQRVTSVVAREQAMRVSAAALQGPVAATKQRQDAARSVLRANHAATRLSDLSIKSPVAGRIVSLLPDRKQGSFVQIGDVVATVVEGKTHVRSWVTEDQRRESDLTIGCRVRVRLSGDSSHDLEGIVVGLAQTPSDRINDDVLTTVADGQITVDPLTGVATQSYYKVEVELPIVSTRQLMHGSRGSLLLKAKYEPIGFWIVRKTKQFLNKILLS